MSIKVGSVTELFNHPSGIEPLEILMDKTTVPVRFRHHPNSRILLISFHGAVNRETRVPPVFAPFLPGLGTSVAQLSVSDPSMLLPGSFGMSWYSGHEGFNAQEILPKLFQQIAEAGGYERVVFFGSSGGGFASLFYSSLMPGSVAIAQVPQTNMHQYYAGHILRYREGCWPSLGSNEELADKICTDLCAWYSQPRPNTVIYLQSAGDHFHTRTQFAPFLDAISRVKQSRFIAHSSYWGRPGHSGAVTPDAYMPWVRAAILSPSTEVDDLLSTHYDLSSAMDQPVAASASAKEKPAAAHGIRMADMLRDFHLSQSKEV